MDLVKYPLLSFTEKSPELNRPLFCSNHFTAELNLELNRLQKHTHISNEMNECVTLHYFCVIANVSHTNSDFTLYPKQNIIY